MNPKTASFMPADGNKPTLIDWLKSHKKLLITILAIIFLLFSLFFFLYSSFKDRFLPSSNPTPPGGAAIELKPTSLMQLKTPKTTFSLNEKIPVTIVASSSDIPITAFDTTIEYDSEFLTLTKRNPPSLNSFEYYGKNSTTQIQVSAYLKPDQTPTKLDNTTLFDIEFTPKKAGKTTIKMIYMPNSPSDSNLLNDQSEDVLGSVKGVEITIE